MASKIGIDDTFPSLTLDIVDGKKIELPGGIDSKYGVILFYRGSW